ncbi:MAG: ketoacyl-ACP synthase III [Bacteroidales bacterium]|nr:ketoacyl-ACP synthase III [Bacteroidales bacterium]
MAFLHYKNVRVVGVSAAVPELLINNLTQETNFSDDYDPKDFVKTTGVLERPVTDTLCTSDLCYEAAEKLIAEIGWNKEDIEALVFVSQTPDYILPATSCILQDRLALSKECYATDCSLGCSGWVYGLSQIMGLLCTGEIKKALLCVGDAKGRVYGPKDPLFGAAGTVTAVEYREGENGCQFYFGTDGSGYDAIITPDGGSRNPVTLKSFNEENIEGKCYNNLMTRMKGMDVFSFGITMAPKSVKKLAEHFGFDYMDYDYFVFHQANMKMNDMIVKKLKIPNEKAPSCMAHFGNTSSASIPLTIVTQLQTQVRGLKKFICCGFGVGLSWGAVAFNTQDLVVPEVLRIKEL